ncbi:MAG: hypothetical protein GWN86_26015, partial [Desulfobacterales bacterium]|nr:hypothetical protein [Desulfobacterales bacterium]
MDIEISRHAKKMLRKRVGTRRAEEFFSEALTEGIPHQECKGQLRAYLDKKGMLHKRCSVIYKGIIFFYSTDPDGT